MLKPRGSGEARRPLLLASVRAAGYVCVLHRRVERAPGLAGHADIGWMERDRSNFALTRSFIETSNRPSRFARGQTLNRLFFPFSPLIVEVV